jgi:hypothetical protein
MPIFRRDKNGSAVGITVSWRRPVEVALRLPFDRSTPVSCRRYVDIHSLSLTVYELLWIFDAIKIDRKWEPPFGFSDSAI